ncbi:fibrobacter succinogenes major paralogous domain-containing protein [Bacteroidota bacterium]
MKKVISHLFVFLSALSLFTQQEPIVKFYLNDGNTKEYIVEDIEDIKIIKSESKFVMHIYYQDVKIAYYPAEIIEKIKFESDTTLQMNLNVYIFGYPKPYILSEIDSIAFKIDIYQPLTICDQVWMLKNLDVEFYRNGEPISQVADSIGWIKRTSGAWCYYNNDPANNAIYGKLYNWFAVNDSRGLVPSGWHVASDEEWLTLTPNLRTDGGKLKEAGTLHWWNPNEGATNESGFSALPGGGRYWYGHFYNIFHGCYFWTSEEGGDTDAFDRSLYFNSTMVYRSTPRKENGFSVRCVKD